MKSCIDKSDPLPDCKTPRGEIPNNNNNDNNSNNNKNSVRFQGTPGSKMKCVLLVAGHATKLEKEIKEDETRQFEHLENVPKALLPGPDGRRLLDNWWGTLCNASQVAFQEVYLVTNADKYKHYERWATAKAFPRENIINDGSTANTGGIGATADFDLVLRSRKIDSDVMVVAGDMLFNPSSFDVGGVVRFFRQKQGNLVCYYNMNPEEDPRTRGIVEVDPKDGRITKFFEKPKQGTTKSRLATVVFYCFRRESLRHMKSFLAANPQPRQRSFGRFMEFLLQQNDPVYGMKLPDDFSLIGSKVGLKEYKEALVHHALPKARFPQTTCRSYARVGLMGNPSDGFFGKTISMSIANFWAEVRIEASEHLRLIPHPLNDPTTFGSLADLHQISRQEGYQGGLRLMQATCKRFYQFCNEHGIAIAKQNFTLRYDTNIPRQVGLAGSSAICTATLKCLMSFFQVTDRDIPKPIQANFVLTVEMQELGINAGLQDRVIQAYNGLVYMDFAKELMEKQEHGDYVEMDISKVGDLWLAYLADPSDSGKMHSDVRLRYDSGDEVVHKSMQQFANFTVDAKAALEKGDNAALADLMDQNFALRRNVYTDKCLGAANLQMIEIAHRHNAAAKFPGSGGAIVGLCRDPESYADLKEEFEMNGFVFVKLIPNPAQK